MKKIKYDLKEMLAEVAKDEQAGKPVSRIVSQDAIAGMLKQKKSPASVPERNGP